PPRKGAGAVARVVREVLAARPTEGESSLEKVLEHCSRTLGRHSLLFFISDFAQHELSRPGDLPEWRHHLIDLAGRHDVVLATVSVEHAAGVRPKLDSLGLDDSWLVLDAQPGATLADPTAAGRARSSWVFEIASLEPGDRVIAAVPLQIGDQKLELESATLA